MATPARLTAITARRVATSARLMALAARLAASPALAYGDGSTASGDHSAAYGDGSTASGFISSAYGNGSTASGNFSSAYGRGSTASGVDSSAFGAGATATGFNSTAVGTGANATFSNSAAYGNGATATRANQQVFGTASNTYTMSGITSSASKAAQVGPTQIVTADVGGNLATASLGNLGIASAADLSALNSHLNAVSSRTDKALSGVAMALAVQNPDLTGNERFGITANWGGFEGENAFGMGFEGVLGHDVLMRGDRFALTGGWGVGFAEGQASDVFGGRVGGQWTWGGHP